MVNMTKSNQIGSTSVGPASFVSEKMDAKVIKKVERNKAKRKRPRFDWVIASNVVPVGIIIVLIVLFPSWLVQIISLSATIFVWLITIDVPNTPFEVQLTLILAAVTAVIMLSSLGLSVYNLAVPLVLFVAAMAFSKLFEVLNIYGDRKRAAVAYACSDGDFEMVKRLVESGANINSSKKYSHVTGEYLGATALEIAASKGNLALVKYLVEHGAEINKVTDYPMSALHAAVENNRYDVTKYLIGKGADVSLKNELYNAPITFAQSDRMAELLIKNGANPKDRGKDSCL